jgi:protein-disulfide isomerase
MSEKSQRFLHSPPFRVCPQGLYPESDCQNHVILALPMEQSSEPNPLLLTIALQDHRQGAIDAPVILIEYGDYQCPYCASVHKMIKTIQQRLDRQLCFVFRHFPQKLHFRAQKAAEAAEAAEAQGKFWQIHDMLFERQQALTDGDLVEYADELGLDLCQFLRAIAYHRYADRVAEDMHSGRQCQVTHTPTLFINQSRYSGAWEVEQLMIAIQRQRFISE